MREWDDVFNPFNSMKILSHMEHWKKIDLKNGIIPFPFAVTLDMNNYCNYNCYFCNSKILHKEDRISLSEEWCAELPHYLKSKGVKALTIAGGGEPLASTSVSLLFENLIRANLPFAIITNGYFIDKYLQYLKYAKFVGVSVDAGTTETYRKVKGVKGDEFEHVLRNISILSAMGVPVTYKFLVTNDNFNEMEKATALAKAMGCEAIHIRPVGVPWFSTKRYSFFKEDLYKINENMQDAHKYRSENFKVYTVYHKFGHNFKTHNNFSKCYAIYIYMLITHDRSIMACCDNRGNEKYVIGKTLAKVEDISTVWGNAKHLDMINHVDVSKCPRCTFGTMNKMFEPCVVRDDMCMDFI